MSETIECPKCGAEFKLTEALAAPLLERQRALLEAQVRQRHEELAARERAVAEQAEDVRRGRAAVEEEVAARLKVEREAIARQESEKAAARLTVDLTDLREQLAEKEKRLGESRQAELELRKQRRELEERQQQWDLQIARQLDEERGKIRDAAQLEMTEQFRLKEAEREQQFQAMRRQIDDLKRRSEQGSQQAQGEVLELELEEMLRARFPGDAIEPVPKGVHGGDVTQTVRGASGAACGTILWETKRSKSWSDGWLPKLRDDQRAARAEIAVLVSVTLPREVTTFAQIDGVWVTSVACAAGVAAALRAGLLETAAVKLAAVGRQGKMEVLYAYLSGPQFKQRVEAIVESFMTLRQDLEKERRAMQKIWASREKQIDRVLENTVGLHGDVAGIIGASLPEIESIELKALALEAE
ncbi:MAG: DUF2130 domain-containing protein [Planctomycetes bacterium]|nr:DUF2130 domain-containing protein [Planctomycetota bacterium]